MATEIRIKMKFPVIATYNKNLNGNISHGNICCIDRKPLKTLQIRHIIIVVSF